MKIESLSCVITGEKSVALKKYELEYKGMGTLIKIVRGGICGSDLHYYRHGRVGNYSVKSPMILGHEVIGVVEQSDNEKLSPGTLIAIDPGKACGQCKYCLDGHYNQCVDMRFFGSAMYIPHVDGGFSQYKIVDSKQCIPYAKDADGRIMVFAEPLAVAIHAVNQAGNIKGKKIFVSGVGPIGCLVVAAARVAGAAEVITTDINERCLLLSRRMGADKTIPANDDDFQDYMARKGYFDVSFEVSGHPSSINRCLQVTRAKGKMVQVGMGGPTVEFPLMMLIAKEIGLTGTFRFTEEFRVAVKWLEEKIVNPLPLLSAEYSFNDFEPALIFAEDKLKASKVQLVF